MATLALALLAGTLAYTAARLDGAGGAVGAAAGLLLAALVGAQVWRLRRRSGG